MHTKPTIIFADENHLNGFIPEFIINIAPKLKEMGYQDFYFESPASDDIDKTKERYKNYFEYEKLLFKHLETIADEVNEQRCVYDLLGIEHLKFMFALKLTHISDPNEFSAYAIILGLVATLQNNYNDKFNFQRLLNALDSLKNVDASAYKPLLLLINMLDAIQSLGLNYHGTDTTDSVNIKLVPTSIATLTTMTDNIVNHKFNEILLGNRDYTMAKNFLSVNNPAFGFCGLAHVQGIQETLIKKVGLDIAKANYHFIYIYTSDDKYMNKLHESLTDVKFNLPIKDLREGKCVTPFEITAIDGRGKSIEEIMQLVNKVIEDKNNEYQKLPATLKEIPDTSYTGIAKTSALRLFKHLTDMTGSAQSSISHMYSKYETKSPTLKN